MKKVSSVEEYIEQTPNIWHNAIRILRNILLETQLQETIKWGAPVYTYSGKNIVGIGAFKNYVGLWFYQGALLTDKQSKLINAQEGKTKALRQWHFTNENEIDKSLVISYINEAIVNQERGLEIKPKKRTKNTVLPFELVEALKGNSKLSTCFENLSPSKKREFAEYISEAKRAETKQRRVEKVIPMIINNQGLNDKYRRK